MCDPNEDAYSQTLCIRFWKSDTWNPFDDKAYRPDWDDLTHGVGQYSVPVSELCDQYNGAEITTKDFRWINSDGSDGGQYDAAVAWVAYMGMGLFNDDSCTI